MRELEFPELEWGQQRNHLPVRHFMSSINAPHCILESPNTYSEIPTQMSEIKTKDSLWTYAMRTAELL